MLVKPLNFGVISYAAVDNTQMWISRIYSTLRKAHVIVVAVFTNLGIHRY